tara:strand:- start:5145 stop:6416 length:1272 start_codon:yes stop_codon:yes gene_type:complete
MRYFWIVSLGLSFLAGCAQHAPMMGEAPAPPQMDQLDGGEPPLEGEDDDEVVMEPGSRGTQPDPPMSFPDDAAEEIPPPSPPRSGSSGGMAQDGFLVKRVLYGTNRRRSGELEPNQFFGAKRGGLQTGYCLVSIPDRHVTGNLEAPSWTRLEFTESPKKHVVLMQVEPASRSGFTQLLREETSKGAKKKAFVFIHGYNVSFKDAARRTAQLAHDLEFQGAPIFFSWPSRSDVKLYFEDRNDNEWSRPDLRKFLKTVITQSEAEDIYIIAHSMGNLVTATVLADVHRSLGSNDRSKIKTVILAAPDIDAETFKRDIAPELAETGIPITVYTSKRDKALLASEQVWDNQRVGQNAEALAGLPGIDAVDSTSAVTDYLHHGYFGDHSRLLRDMNLVFSGVSAGEGKRSYLQSKSLGQGKRYWMLAP